MEDMWVFESHLHQFDSELAVHLRMAGECTSPTRASSIYLVENLCHAGMVPALYIVEWFMTVFASVLPNKCVCRIWDVLFAEGLDKI